MGAPSLRFFARAGTTLPSASCFFLCKTRCPWYAPSQRARRTGHPPSWSCSEDQKPRPPADIFDPISAASLGELIFRLQATRVTLPSRITANFLALTELSCRIQSTSSTLAVGMAYRRRPNLRTMPARAPGTSVKTSSAVRQFLPVR